MVWFKLLKFAAYDANEYNSRLWKFDNDQPYSENRARYPRLLS